MIEMIKPDFDLAGQGRELWKALEEEHGINNEWLTVILVPGYDGVNDIVLQKIPQYLKRKYIDMVLLITTDTHRPLDIQGKLTKWERITEREMKALLKYYRLSQFSKNIVVTAIEEPYGNWGIIGKSNISLEDYVENGLLV